MVGQDRAAQAIRFGTRIERPGFNLFVIGPPGAAMQQAVQGVLKTQARAEPSPKDWVYVNNFVDADKPIAIELPAGRAPKFRDAVHELIDDFKTAMPAVFQSEDYQTRRSAIDEEFHKKQGEAFAALSEKANEKSIAIMRTPFGFALAPTQDGKVVPPEEFSTWPEARRSEVQATMQELEKELEHVVRQLPKLEKERRDAVRQLNRETAKLAVDQLIQEAKSGFADLPRIAEHFEAVRTDLIDNIAIFMGKAEEEDGEAAARGRSICSTATTSTCWSPRRSGTRARRSSRSCIRASATWSAASTTSSVHGALVTNFRFIKAGAMHRANGGYLLLDARHLLMEPFSWTALKRILRRGEIEIEDISRFLGLTSTLSLDPDPIPLDVKVVLFGDRLLYFLLAALDPELGGALQGAGRLRERFRPQPGERVGAGAPVRGRGQARRPAAVRPRRGRAAARARGAPRRPRRQAHAPGRAAARRAAPRRTSGRRAPIARWSGAPTSSARSTSASAASRACAIARRRWCCRRSR